MIQTDLFSGLALGGTSEYLWLRSARPLRVLSSGVLGDDLGHARHVLSVRVFLHYDSDTPEDDLQKRAAALGIAEPFIGMLTAVDLSRVVVQQIGSADGFLVATVATVGVGNATAAGSPARRQYPGTINLVVVVDGDMRPGAMVNAVITATEAKSIALVESGVRTPDGELASGTSSDAIVIGCTGRGPLARYAGAATGLGLSIGQTVRQAVGIGLEIAQGGRLVK